MEAQCLPSRQTAHLGLKELFLLQLEQSIPAWLGMGHCFAFPFTTVRHCLHHQMVLLGHLGLYLKLLTGLKLCGMAPFSVLLHLGRHFVRHLQMGLLGPKDPCLWHPTGLVLHGMDRFFAPRPQAVQWLQHLQMGLLGLKELLPQTPTQWPGTVLYFSRQAQAAQAAILPMESPGP